MDLSVFQIGMSRPVNVAHELAAPGSAPLAWNSSSTTEDPKPRERATANSANLDLLRSFAVTLVVGFHLAKFFNLKFAGLRITDFGLLGVMLFFVHTTLVLMFSLERQSMRPAASLFFPFMVRRCFRIYPLALAVVLCVYLFHIPSDLQSDDLTCCTSRRRIYSQTFFSFRT